MQGFSIVRTDRNTIRQKQRVEFRALGSLSNLPVMRDILSGIGLRAWMAPTRNVMACRLQKCPELELFLCCTHDATAAVVVAASLLAAATARVFSGTSRATLRRPSTLTGISPAIVTRRTTRRWSP